jgi:hypothetical protein
VVAELLLVSDALQDAVREHIPASTQSIFKQQVCMRLAWQQVDLHITPTQHNYPQRLNCLASPASPEPPCKVHLTVCPTADGVQQIHDEQTCRLDLQAQSSCANGC